MTTITTSNHQPNVGQTIVITEGVGKGLRGKVIAVDGYAATVRWGTWYQRFYQWLRRVWWRMIEKLLDFVDGDE